MVIIEHSGEQSPSTFRIGIGLIDDYSVVRSTVLDIYLTSDGTCKTLSR
jgi:hypothetical protein